MKLDRALGYEEGFFAILQTYYDIARYKEKELASMYSEAPRIRRSLFWDADFNKINWGKYKNAVIKRVFERGSKDEIDEISRYYNLSIK